MVTTEDICQLSLEDIATRIRRKDVSPVEITEALLARIERLQPSLNAYITVTGEAALAEARTAEAQIARGACKGALHGVPIAHKDLLDTKGVLTTMGSTLLDANVPAEDALAVSKLRAAGAISLGKLGLHEWAFGLTSDNQWYGTIHNPWDTARVPGGSSGGSGAAVAAGLAFAATGSDTGGSIRVPAAFCGCVGLMPTYGRVSLRGALPLSWSLDHIGPLTRNVRDAAIVLQAIAGHDPRDPQSSPHPVQDFSEGIDAGPQGLRIGVPKQHFWQGALDADVEASARAALDALANAGAEVREIDFPQGAAYGAACGVVTLVEAAKVHEATFPSQRERYSDEVAGRLDVGLGMKGTTYASAMRTLLAARGGEADAALEGVDVLAVPTVPCVAPRIEETRADNSAGRIVAWTGPFDLTGQPVLAVPTGLTPSGMPVSISFVARRWDEPSALRAGRAWELLRGAFPAPAL